MQQLGLGETEKLSKVANLSPEELIQRNSILQAELIRLIRENYELRSLKVTDEQIQLLMQEQLESLRDAEYGASSERYKRPAKKPEEPKAPAKPWVKR